MTDFHDRRNRAAREMAAAKKAAAGFRNTSYAAVPREELEARLAEIPPDTRNLTQRLMGDPIPADPRRFWRTA